MANINKHLIACISVISLILISPIISGQEKQVPFFPEQEIVTIEKNYAKKMSLFEEYENFVEARLYELADSLFAIEVFYEKDGLLYKDRKILTGEQKEAYLQSLVQAYADKSDEEIGADEEGEVKLLNQRGRTAMLITNTITGLGYYGYALPLSLGVEDDKAFVGLYMLAAGTSFYLPYRLTAYKDVTLAQASFTFYGQSRGVMHGLFLGDILTTRPNYEDYANTDDYRKIRDRQNQLLFGMGIVTSIGGGIAMNRLATKWDYSGGSTSIFQMWGDVGTVAGLLTSELVGFTDRRELDATFATTIVTSAAGMVVGKFFGDTRDYTLGDAIVYRSNLFLATGIALTIANYFEPDDFSAYTGAAVAGLALGSYTGWRSTLNKDFGTSESVFIALGELAGGLLGLGVGYLISPDINEGKVITTTAVLGAATGYGLMYGQFKDDAANLATKANLDVRLNPFALFMQQDRPVRPDMLRMYDVASLRVRF